MQGWPPWPPGHFPWKGCWEQLAYRCEDTQLQPWSGDRMSTASPGSLKVATEPQVRSQQLRTFPGSHPSLSRPRTKNELGP